jgi:uncharacterized protein YecE (DUF72 family)
MTRVYYGTSGFSYKEWKGPFYPEDLKNADMLAWYAERLPAVEINNTFYRMPKREVLEGWCEQVPGDFRFVLKASRRITHHKRLKECEEPLGYLIETSAALGERRGPFLFQLPPNMKPNLERLVSFLGLLPEGVRGAFEFRHPEWHTPEVHDLLRGAGAALCVADTGGDDPEPVATTDWGYLRLRREGYDDEELQRWAEWVRAQGWREVYAFFKHEDAGAGPKLARRFAECLGESPPEV